MKKSLFLFTGAIVIAFAAFWITACEQDKVEATSANDPTAVEDRCNGNSKVYPPNAHPHGKSYAEWSIQWLQEFMTHDCANNPFLNPSDALFYQTGPVYFLAGLNTPGASTDITVPHGKAILLPLVNYINDYPCPDPAFQPAPGQTLEEFLAEGAADIMDQATGLEVTLDGNTLTNLANYRFQTDLFYFTGNPDMTSCFDPCITGNEQAGVGDGYYIMLKPLSHGQHTLHFLASIPGWLELDATYNITVQ